MGRIESSLSRGSREYISKRVVSDTTLLGETYCYEACSSQLFEDKILHSLSSKS
jgi:hypothetical protein